MNRQEIVLFVAAVLSTLNELGEAPETGIYLALKTDIHKYNLVRDLMLGAGFIQIKHNLVSLTPLGKEKAEEVDAAYKEAKKQQKAVLESN